MVEVRARLAFTGETNMNIGVEVRGGDLTDTRPEKVAECLVVVIALDAEGRPMLVNSWTPETPGEMALASSARAQFESTRPAPLE
jgi:acyl-CoA hydrolase